MDQDAITAVTVAIAFQRNCVVNSGTRRGVEIALAVDFNVANIEIQSGTSDHLIGIDYVTDGKKRAFDCVGHKIRPPPWPTAEVVKDGTNMLIPAVVQDANTPVAE